LIGSGAENEEKRRKRIGRKEERKKKGKGLTDTRKRTY
jgi:hypothetical protein